MSNSFTPLLAHLWQKNRPLMLERLRTLDNAAKHPDDRSLCEESIVIAHKLAGSLGMFGFTRGSELARTLEVGLETGSLALKTRRELVVALHDELFPAEPGNSNTEPVQDR